MFRRLCVWNALLILGYFQFTVGLLGYTVKLGRKYLTSKFYTMRFLMFLATYPSKLSWVSPVIWHQTLILDSLLPGISQFSFIIFPFLMFYLNSHNYHIKKIFLTSFLAYLLRQDTGFLSSLKSKVHGVFAVRSVAMIVGTHYKY